MNPSAPKASYVACTGADIYDKIQVDKSLKGVFGLTVQVGVARFATIVDGTSHTLMYGEVIQSPPSNDCRTIWWEDQCGRFINLHTPNSSAPDNFHTSACVDRPEHNEPCARIPSRFRKHVFQSSRSRHPGGVHGCLADGGVRFFGDSIDLTTWRSLATMAGGEVFDAF